MVIESKKSDGVFCYIGMEDYEDGWYHSAYSELSGPFLTEYEAVQDYNYSTIPY